MAGAYADVSQSHSRRCFSCLGEPVPTLTSSTVLYSFDQDSIVHPTELMRWHGFPRNLVFPPDARDVRSLVGNSMCAPSLAQAIAALTVLLHTT